MGLLNNIRVPEHLWNNIYQTGSSVICNPPVLYTDFDFVIYSYKYTSLISWLTDNGFKTSELDDEEYDSEGSEGIFCCMRRGKVNLIIVQDYEFYMRWVIATDLAKRFNLLNKGDRIALFDAILYPPDHSTPF